MEAVPERIPFAPLVWSPLGSGREEAPLAPDPSVAWAGMLSTELGADGHHAMLQFSQFGTCGEDEYRIRRLVDLASGATVGAYRMTYPCGSGAFAPESALTGGLVGHDAAGTSHMIMGSRQVGERGWSWWPEPLPLLEMATDKIHDVADGTLVLRTPSALRVALARDSNVLTQIAEQSAAGAAGDDVFVWSTLLTPSGSLLRAWDRKNGVRDVAHLPADACLVSATDSHIVGMTGEGDCLSYLANLRFIRFPRGADGTEQPMVEGIAVPSQSRLGIRKLVAYGHYAAVFVAEDSYDDNRQFILVLRYSDQTLWRINHRPGMTLFGHDSFTLTPDYLYLLERPADNSDVMPSAQRLSLDAIEEFAVPF